MGVREVRSGRYNRLVNKEQLRSLLTAVAQNGLPIDEALEQLRRLPFEQLSFATVDHHRALRCGHGEVIFCQGKTVEQVVEIARRLSEQGAEVLCTRASADQLVALATAFPESEINPIGRAAIVRKIKLGKESNLAGPSVGLVCAGTADLPVLEEAEMTLRSMKIPFSRICDVGVSGLHRLLSHLETLQSCCAIVVIAGMEGALPSVVGGLVGCPVFAVPTSVGYGASFGGLAALLGMLNSCASNVSVLNIDNGFGGAYSAALVQQQVRRFAAT